MSIPVGYEFGERMSKIGAARFTGNQHNENWDWSRSYFQKLTEEELVKFYKLSK